MNSTEILKQEMISEIYGDRKAWRLTIIPQLITILMLIIGLSYITGYGLYISVHALKTNLDVSTLAKASKVFVGGGSSILGFVVVQLMVKLSEISKLYIKEEQKFTANIGKVKLATSQSNLAEILEDYGKK